MAVNMKKMTDTELIDELKQRLIDKENALQDLQQLTGELKTANRKLEESEAMKSHFISNITNEIINPFASIIGLSRSILSVSKEEWKKVITMVSLIHAEAFNLDFQLRNIFVAAKIEAGEISPEIMRVDVHSLINSMIDTFKFVDKRRCITINYQTEISGNADEPFYFNTDSEWLRLILSNLISNAVKYSFDKGIIEIRSWMEGDVLHISVKDEGTGISEDNQKTIFDRFKRLDSGINSINRGHGLGLSINKALLDFLNGKIEVKSKKDNGATFTIFIPESQEESGGMSPDGNEFLFETEEENF